VAEAVPEGGAAPARSGLSHERPLGLSSSIVFVIGVLIQGIGFVGNYFVSHHIGIYIPGQTAIGISGLFLTIASTVSGLADLRVGSAYTYFIARGRKAEELTGTYVALRLSMVVAVCVGLFLLSPLFYFTQGAFTCPPGGGCTLSIPASTEVAVFGIFMITPLLWSPGVVYTQLWVARGDSVRSQYPLLIQSVVQTIGLIGVAFLAPSQQPVVELWGFAFAYLLGAVASAAYSLPTVIRFGIHFQAGTARRMFGYAWPLMGGLMLGYVWTNAPAFFVVTLSGAALAIFLAGNGFRILLLAIPNAISVPLFPHLTNLHVRREYEALRRRTWAALRYTAMIIVPGAVGMVVYRTPLLNTLFVGTYVAQGSMPLAILAISAVPASLSQIILTSFTSVGRQRLDLYLTALQVAVLLGFCLLVLPPYAPLSNWGIDGAAYAILASSLAGLALNVYFVEKILAIRIQPRPIIAITVSAAVSFFVVSRLNQFINPNRWFILFPALLLGFAVYYLVLSAMGELTKRDVLLLGGYVGLPWRVRKFLAWFCRREEPRDAGELLTDGEDVISDAGLDETRVRDDGDMRRGRS
jgi:O-antigen/teichoic acid export membrane protein